jgi:hypothetical protein
MTHYYPDDSLPTQFRLRESLLRRRLDVLVSDLIININPEQTDGNSSRSNSEADAVANSLFQAIRASALNIIAPSRGIQFRFDGTLKRDKPDVKNMTSFVLFCDDVERLLRDLYGDVDHDMLAAALCAVRVIVTEFTQFVRKKLWQEHFDALNSYDYFVKGDYKSERRAIEDLRTRVRDVSTNPAGHSKYTIRFTELYKKWDKHWDSSQFVEPSNH